MSIVLLDDNTISKISAGEIIENPASVVKELLENSIDAGAKNITVEVKNSPTDFIRITDDGCGFKADEIELAFMRHSTSKLSKIESETGASTATISRINRSLNYGADGYKIVLEKLGLLNDNDKDKE